MALGRPQTEFQILFLAPSLNVVNDEISRSYSNEKYNFDSLALLIVIGPLEYQISHDILRLYKYITLTVASCSLRPKSYAILQVLLSAPYASNNLITSSCPLPNAI